MARYLQQPDITLPSAGNNIIHHFVKTFENIDKDLLDTEINLWLLSLEVISSNPVIRETHFHVFPKPDNPDKGAPLYQTQIHYILVE